LKPFVLPDGSRAQLTEQYADTIALHSVVQIPPRAVLSYPNVFCINPTDRARHQTLQWQLSAANPTTITSSSQHRREAQYPTGTAHERSGVGATSSTGVDWLSLVNTGATNIDESGADAGLALSLALLNELCVLFFFFFFLFFFFLGFDIDR
jgi:hypothetical protein